VRSSQIKTKTKQAAATSSLSTRSLSGKKLQIENEDAIARMPGKSTLESYRRERRKTIILFENSLLMAFEVPDLYQDLFHRYFTAS